MYLHLKTETDTAIMKTRRRTDVVARAMTRGRLLPAEMEKVITKSILYRLHQHIMIYGWNGMVCNAINLV